MHIWNVVPRPKKVLGRYSKSRHEQLLRRKRETERSATFCKTHPELSCSTLSRLRRLKQRFDRWFLSLIVMCQHFNIHLFSLGFFLPLPIPLLSLPNLSYLFFLSLSSLSIFSSIQPTNQQTNKKKTLHPPTQNQHLTGTSLCKPSLFIILTRPRRDLQKPSPEIC